MKCLICHTSIARGKTCSAKCRKVLSRSAGVVSAGDGTETFEGSIESMKPVPYKDVVPTMKTMELPTCKNGHRALDGKHCMNAKCVYS